MPSTAEWIQRASDELKALRIPELRAAGVLPHGDQFLPVVSYPPITMYPKVDGQALLAAEVDPPPQRTAAYVHVPFCARGCSYCHWVKKIGPSTADIDDYIDTVSAEMDLALARLGRDRIPVSTCLFGGGTPTLPTARQLDRLITAFRERFPLDACRQFSFEAEPGNLLGPQGAERLAVLRDHGVQRISMGVQSFDDAILERMRRTHTAREALEAIEAIHEAGIDSVSIDLIYGYLGLSVEDWIRTMQTALSSGADAWHLYRLRIKRYGEVQGQVLHEYVEAPEDAPEAERVWLMKMLGIVMSEDNGYHQHFTRIFSTQRRHITEFMWDYCCELADVVGTGPSAWSNYHRTFTLNWGARMDTWRDEVRAGRLPVERGILRDLETEARRSFLLPLKNDRVIKRKFEARTGLNVQEHLGAELARLEGLGLLQQDERSVSLTPRGRFFADETMWQLTQRQHVPFPEVLHSLMPD
jgi:oxygen-independent coproporphyrinogen-3 oxidase